MYLDLIRSDHLAKADIAPRIDADIIASGNSTIRTQQFDVACQVINRRHHPLAVVIVKDFTGNKRIEHNPILLPNSQTAIINGRMQASDIGVNIERIDISAEIANGRQIEHAGSQPVNWI